MSLLSLNKDFIKEVTGITFVIDRFYFQGICYKNFRKSFGFFYINVKWAKFMSDKKNTQCFFYT